MSILGNRVLRKEDPRFLRGEATYVENLPLEGARTVTFVRSLLAHARIIGVDTSRRRGAAGRAGLHRRRHRRRRSAPPPIPVLEQRMGRPVVAKDVVRFVGDIVAVVVSEDRATGRGRRRARLGRLRPAAGRGRPGRGGEGRGAALPGRRDERRRPRRPHGPRPDALRRLRRRRLRHARQPAHGRRARSRCARRRPSVDATARVTAWLSTQVPHRDHHGLAADARASSRSSCASSPRTSAAASARRARSAPRKRSSSGSRRHLGTPVRWTETRSENMIALPHGRGQRLELTLGGTRDGKVLAYRLDVLAGLRRLSRRRRLPAEPDRR